MIHAPEVTTTERLTLRRPTLTDAADVYAYAHDPEVTRYMVWPIHKETAKKCGSPCLITEVLTPKPH